MSARIHVVGPPADKVTPKDIAEAIALIGNLYLGDNHSAILGLMWSYAILLGETEHAIMAANAMAPCDSCRTSAERA